MLLSDCVLKKSSQKGMINRTHGTTCVCGRVQGLLPMKEG